MSDLSPETNKLLELARGAGALGDARRAQIRAGLLSQIAAGGTLGAAASHAGWGKAAWLTSPLAKGMSALALLSAVGVGVYVGARTPSRDVGSPLSAPSSTSVSQKPAKGVDAARPRGGAEVTPGRQGSAASDPGSNGSNAVISSTPSTPAPSVSGSGASVGHSPSSKATPIASHAALASEPASFAPSKPSADTLAEETRLLRDADQALRAGNAQRALSLLDEHAARYPHGVLEPERTAERMIARCKLGQVDAKSAQAYLTAHPSSPFSARLADACSSANR